MFPPFNSLNIKIQETWISFVLAGRFITFYFLASHHHSRVPSPYNNL